MMQVNNDIWHNIYAILMEKKCTDIELNLIMRRWGELLNQRTVEVRNRDELEHRLLNRLHWLQEKAESGENGIVDQSIYALSICSNISDNDIKQLIEYAHKGGIQMYDKIFISHSSEDGTYVEALVNFLEDMGLKSDNIFCTSIAQYGVPLGEDFNERIKEQFTKYNIFVLFVLSDNYYKSAACLNEMGAAWVLQKDYISILLPGFEYKQIKGAINPTRIAIKMDDREIEYKLEKFRDKVMKFFRLESIERRKWDRAVKALLEATTDK